ncbi:MAG: AAA family ATPase [Chloroflexi bacterium]|nr:AAA family ATPase [Chloroflexota bacterium]
MLSPDRAPATPGEPVAERRLVTVLFADLVGFTSLSEARDAEDVQDLMDRYFALATEVIGRYAGHVEKFIGDAVAAMWGAPVAHEDDAERAVRAALDLVASVPSIDPALELRAGVLTGELAVTLGSWTQGKVVGDIVNTAARLQSVAPAGRVLVGESTRLAAARAIFFEEAGTFALKGKATPVPAWLAVGVASATSGLGRPDSHSVPFVGRARELRQLAALFDATVANRHAQLVIVTGAPGIGKSRLAGTLELELAASGKSGWWHHGRAPAYLNGVAFWALGEMIRERAGLVETDDAATTHQKVAEMMAAHVPDEAERQWIEPAMLALLGVTDTEAAPDELFAAWRTFFERLSDARPVVLAFEDLHLADPGLLDFVEQLLEWSPDRPIFVLALARPELLEARADWAGSRRNTTLIVLQPLPDTTVRELLDDLVTGLAPDTADLIVDRADGVPLYAIETLRMLEARGDFRRDGGSLVAVRHPSSLAIPDTLTALVGARLDALDPRDRSLLQHAAVLGQTFSVMGLAAVSGRRADELRAQLGVLTEHDIVAEVTDPRSPERGQFTFVQALTRDVAYRTLTRRDRRERHLAAARYLERTASVEVAGALAAHYLAAFESAETASDSADVGTDARRALIRAAERASALGSARDALSLLERAMAIGAAAGNDSRLSERAATEAMAAGEYSRAGELAQQAMSVAVADGDRLGAARAVALRSAALNSLLRSDEAEAVIIQFLETAGDIVGSAEHAVLTVRIANLRALAHDHSAAIQWADLALIEAERHDLVRAVAAGLIAKGSALGYEGRGYEAMSIMRGAYAIAEANGLNQEMLGALTNLSDALIARDPRAALETARTGVALVRRLGRLDYLANMSMNGMYAAFRTGDWDWAIAEGAALEEAAANNMDRAVGIFGPLPIFAARGIDVTARAAEATAAVADGTDNQMAAFVEDRLGTIALAVGDLEEAYDRCSRAGSMIAWLSPLAYVNAARIALWQRDAGRAGAMLAGLRESTRGPAIAAGMKTIEAGLAALAGDHAAALSAYDASLAMWQDLGLPVDQALTGIDIATLLGPGDPEVEAAAATTRSILEGLGAGRWLARLDAAMRVRPTPQRKI